MAIDEILTNLQILYDPGDVIEIRYFPEGSKKVTHSGYYDYEHFDKCALDISKVDELKNIPAIYATVNPVQNVLLARANNRIRNFAKTTTSEDYTRYRKYLPFDIDPKRPAETSSSDEDHNKCISKAYEIKKWLNEIGWPDPIIADSGNGAHLLYRINETNSPTSKELIEKVQLAVTTKFNHPELDGIDIQGWQDANRIWKVYGTKTQKGDELPGLGIHHRRSKILEVPEQIIEVNTLQLNTMAGTLKKEEIKNIKDIESIKQPVKQGGKIYDVKSFMANNNIEVIITKEKSNRTIYVIETCPFNPEHTGNGETAIIQWHDGKLGFKCHHNSCADKRWVDVRELLEPGYKDKRSNGHSFSDYGNAKRLLDVYGDDIKYCYEMKEWYVWDGTRWKQDQEGMINQYAKKTVLDQYELLSKMEDMDKRKMFFKFILSCENQNKLKSMIDSATNEPGVPISYNKFDCDLDLINVANGIIDLKTGVLMPHDKSELMSKKIDINYNPNAECKRFEKFLSEILPINPEIITFLQRWFGYSLTGQTSEQVFCIFYGHGSNGKGTLIDTIMSVMGEYAKTTEPETVIKKNTERNSTNDLAVLKGARFVTTSETEANAVLDEGRIKRITGQDNITCRFLYKEFFDYQPEFKFALLTNHEPIIKAQDYSIWRRVLKIPFNVSIPKEKWDLQLRDTLLSEKEGILAWMVKGAMAWYQDRLEVPNSIKLATAEYKQELDILGDFLEICTNNDSDKKESLTDLYKIYTIWCEATDNKIWTKNTVSRGLAERGYDTKKSNGIRYKIGLEIRKPLLENNDVTWFLNELQKQEKRIENTGSQMRPFGESIPYRILHEGTLHNLQKCDPENIADNDSQNNATLKIKNSNGNINDTLASTGTTGTTGTSATNLQCGYCKLIFNEEDLNKDPSGKYMICHNCQIELITKNHAKINQPITTQLDAIKLIRDTINNLSEGGITKISDTIIEVNKLGITADRFSSYINQMKREGSVFEPQEGYLKCV